jgi:transposase
MFSVHPNLMSLWKKQLLDSADMVFEKAGKGKEEREAEKKQEELFKQIGQLQVEKEFLKKSTSNCAGQSRRCRARAWRALGMPLMRITWNK